MKITYARIRREVESFSTPSYQDGLQRKTPMHWWLKKPGSTAVYLRYFFSIRGAEPYGN